MTDEHRPTSEVELREELLAAFVAGFRHSAEGYNGEYTPPTTPDPWDDEIAEHGYLLQEFGRWLEPRKKVILPELRALIEEWRDEAANRPRLSDREVIRDKADELEELLE